MRAKVAHGVLHDETIAVTMELWLGMRSEVWVAMMGEVWLSIRARWKKLMDLVVGVNVSLSHLVPHELQNHVGRRNEWRSVKQSGGRLVVLVTFA